MERYLLCFLCLCLTVPTFAQDGTTQRVEHHTAAVEHFEKLGTLFRHSAEQAIPAVVSIRVTRTRAIGRSTPFRVSEEGSGIVATIADRQVILTNRHVIEEAERGSIEIMTHDRRLLTLTRFFANADFDVAIIEVAETLPQSAVFGNSDQVRVGDIVLAIGNPFGLDRSVSMGIISAMGRREVPGATISAPRIDFFQTDAAINPGSSGGMLLNLRGEVIGVVTAIATQGGRNEGVAFVMPINGVLRIAEQLVRTGTVVRPYIGFNFVSDGNFPMEDRRPLGIDRLIGARIHTVFSNSPAERAGLEVGDVVLMFGNTEVENDTHILHLIAQSEIDEPVVLRINREGEILDVTVTPIRFLSH